MSSSPNRRARRDILPAREEQTSDDSSSIDEPPPTNALAVGLARQVAAQWLGLPSNPSPPRRRPSKKVDAEASRSPGPGFALIGTLIAVLAILLATGLFRIRFSGDLGYAETTSEVVKASTRR